MTFMILKTGVRRRAGRWRSDAKRTELARLNNSLDQVLADTAPPPRVSSTPRRKRAPNGSG